MVNKCEDETAVENWCALISEVCYFKIMLALIILRVSWLLEETRLNRLANQLNQLTDQ